MPMIEVKFCDRRVTEESVPKMIEAPTNALAESNGAAPEHVHFVIQGVDPKHGALTASNSRDGNANERGSTASARKPVNG